MEDRRYFDLDLTIRRLDERQQGADPRIAEVIQSEIETGWICHDNALEGIVLSYREIKAAIDEKLLIAGREGAIYEGIRDHKAAIDFVKNLGRKSNKAARADISVTLLRELHELLTPTDKAKGSPYRSGTPPHRNYHHGIVEASRIPACMRKLCESMEADGGSLHPIARAAHMHIEFMTIYPWTQNNGKVARLLMNLLLLRDGYPPIVIRGVERQRYYESLHHGSDSLAELIADTLSAYCSTANQLLDELAALRGTRG